MYEDDEDFQEIPEKDPWDDIPKEAPNGSKYGWFDLNDITGFDTVLYETIDGKKVEVSQVTVTKANHIRAMGNFIFVGFVTKCLRYADSELANEVSNVDSI